MVEFPDNPEPLTRYRVLFDTMAHGVVYQDSEGKIISANPAAERILGITLDQMLGRKSMDPRWRAIRPDGSPFPGKDHPAMVSLRTGLPVRDIVMGVFNPGLEEIRWINISAIPLFRPGEDRPFQVYSTFRDITTQVLSEVENRQHLRELELYASVIRHDIANDLQVIMSYIEASEMLSRGETVDPFGMLDPVKAAIERMAHLLTSFGQPSELREENLVGLLKRIASSSEAVHKGLTVKVKATKDARRVSVNFRLLNVVMENLLRNAAEYCGDDVTVEISVNATDENILIEVSDNGPGIPEEIKPRLFEKGVSTNGSGLGLYLVREVLKIYNGSIGLLDNGHGASFLIALPLIIDVIQTNGNNVIHVVK